MLFVFFNFNLDFFSIRIGLIPDFIGYFLMLKGLSELEEFSGHFTKIKPYVKGMIIFSVIIYSLDFIGITPMLGVFLSYALGMISIIMSLYISYEIIIGISDIEKIQQHSLNVEQLYSTWKLLVIVIAVTYISSFVSAIYLICMLASLVFHVYFLYLFSKTKNLYYAG